MADFTEEAIKDDRYHIHPYIKINIHPKEWYQAWGTSFPALWRVAPLIGPKSECKLYPRYTKAYGWEWVTERKRHP